MMRFVKTLLPMLRSTLGSPSCFMTMYSALKVVYVMITEYTIMLDMYIFFALT